MWLSPIARCLAVSFPPSIPTADLLKTCTDLLSRPHNRVSGPALKLLMPSSQEVILEKMRRKKFWNITEVFLAPPPPWQVVERRGKVPACQDT